MNRTKEITRMFIVALALLLALFVAPVSAATDELPAESLYLGDTAVKVQYLMNEPVAAQTLVNEIISEQELSIDDLYYQVGDDPVRNVATMEEATPAEIVALKAALDWYYDEDGVRHPITTPLEVVSVEAITATTVNATFAAPATAAQAGEYEWNVASVDALVGFSTTATATVAEDDAWAAAILADALPASGTYVLDGVEFVWTEPVDMYDVTFTVVDGEDVAIEDATVDLDGVEQLTDINGTAVFSVEAGEYNWSVSKTGYVTEEAIGLLVEDNVTVPVTLVNEVQAALDAVNAATTDATTRDAFVSYADVLGLNLVDYNKFTAYQRTTIIANAVRVNKPDGGYTSGAQIQEEINDAAFDGILKGQLNADVTTNLIEQYPYTLGLDLADYNTYLPYANRTGLGNINPKQEVATLLNTTNPFINTTQVEVNFTNVIGGWNAVIAVNNANDGNIVAILEAHLPQLEDVPAAAFPLTNENYTRWVNLTADRKELVAFIVLDGVTDNATFLGTPYENVQELTNATNLAIADEFGGDVDDAVAAVNDAADTAAMRAALDQYHGVLGLDMAAYNSFSEGVKNQVADEMLDGQSYADEAAIKNAFNAAVAKGAVFAVNEADTTASMKDALVANKDGLGIDPKDAEGERPVENRWQYYVAFEVAEQDIVADAVVDGRDYNTTAEIGAVFNASVNQTAEAVAVPSINALQGAAIADMRITLETPNIAFGLNTSEHLVIDNITTGLYSNFVDMSKNRIAEKMLEHLDDGLYEGTTPAINITNDFLAAVDAEAGSLDPVAIAEVKASQTRDSMNTALSTYKTVINITPVYDDMFLDLATAGQNKVLDRMIAKRATFDETVFIKDNFTVNVSIQTINEATGVADVRAVLENPNNRSVEALGILESRNYVTYLGYGDSGRTNVSQYVFDAIPFTLWNSTGVNDTFNAGINAEKAYLNARVQLQNVNTATDKAAVLHVLNYTVNRTALGTGGEPETVYNLWNVSAITSVGDSASNFTKIENIANAIFLNKTYTTQTAFNATFNEWVSFEILNNVNNTSRTMTKAIKDFGNYTSYIDTTADSYWNVLTAYNQTAAAEAFNLSADADARYATYEAMQTAFDANVTREVFNQSVWAIDGSADLFKMSDNLTKTAYQEVLEFTMPANPIAVSRAVYKDKEEESYLAGGLNNTQAAANITNAIDSIKVINAATTTSAMKAVIKNVDVQLAINRSSTRSMDEAMVTFDGYANKSGDYMPSRINRTTDYQDLISTLVLTKRATENDFANFNTVINQSVSDYGNITSNLTTVNNAADTPTMKAAITFLNNTITLVYEDDIPEEYRLIVPQWDVVDQDSVAFAVLATRKSSHIDDPKIAVDEGEFWTIAELQAAIEEAIALLP